MNYSKFSKIPILIFLFCNGLLSNAQIVVNEVFFTNCSVDLITPDYNYLNWIEIYNSSASTISLSQYYLSDDSTNLKKWRMTNTNLVSKGFIAYFTDGEDTLDHSNLKPNADGGFIYIANSNGVLIDKFAYPKQIFNVSYGRKTNGANEFAYFNIPTRAKSNTSAPIAKQAPVPVISKNGGYYPNTVNVTIQNPSSTGKVYFTTDGSEPVETSNLYTSAITINKTTVLRVRLFETGSAPSKIITETYFINQRIPKLPVVSVVTAPKNLFDNTIGIYCVGTNGITGNGANNPVNWNQDWERCVNIEVYDTSKNQVVNQMVGAKISGAWSRLHDQKSLSLHAKNKYGKKRFHYRFFDNREFNDFNSILLRDGGNDWNNTMFRDAMIQQLTEYNMELDHQLFKQAVVFINGNYYGLQPFYERSNEDLIEAKYGINEDNLDLLEWSGVALKGSGNDYNALMSFINKNSLKTESNYKKVADQIDIDEFIDYLILEIYSGNRDWPGNNNKIWRKSNPKSKWRWIIYDTDFGFGLYDNVSYNMLKMALTNTTTSWPNPEYSTRLFRKLVENEGFKKLFINRFYAHINTTFSPLIVNKTIDSMANEISEEITYHFTKWNVDPNQWKANVNIMKSYANDRPSVVRGHLQEQFGLGAGINIKCQSAPGGKGFISFDNVNALDTAFVGTFPSGTITRIKFIPAPGYQFKKVVRTSDGNLYTTFIKSGDTWKYWDKGDGITSNWNINEFDDKTWLAGPSQLGYGIGREKTVISYGPNTSNIYPTSYFRKNFDFDPTQKISNLKYRILYDDGAVIYLNGKEINRVNMPAGTITYSTLTSSTTSESTFFEFKLDSSLLLTGKNTIAVEVHQAKSSTDLSFDFELTGILKNPESKKEITIQAFSDTLKSNITYTAIFEPTTTLSNIIINEVASNNKSFEDEAGEKDDWFEIYNNGNDTVDLANLFFTDSIEIPLLANLTSRHPEATRVAPGEYKIIWADKQLPQGPLHINFKLDKTGEHLAVFQLQGKNIIKLNDVTIVNTSSQFTFGRFPNIFGDFKMLFDGTPGTENLDLPVTINEVAKADGIGKITFNQSGKTLQVEYYNDNVNVNGQIVVADMNGRIMFLKIINQYFTALPLNKIKPGIYLVRATFNNQVLTSKILVQ